jgi:hypothetical protein
MYIHKKINAIQENSVQNIDAVQWRDVKKNRCITIRGDMQYITSTKRVVQYMLISYHIKFLFGNT